MARTTRKLTTLQVAKLRKPGMHPDGAGLYLQVTPGGARSWIFRYMLNGRAREMGLGSAATVGLAKARKKADQARALRDDGIDPIDAREADRRNARLEAAKGMTFADAAKAFLAAQGSVWSNKKHAKQWPSTLERYVYPVFGDMPVSEVDTQLVARALDPIWHTKTETASRVRQRVEKILDWATTMGYRAGENPARWKGKLAHVFPAPSKIHEVQHHPSLPFAEVPSFMAKLRAQDGIASRALELTILTVPRTDMTIKMTWDEVDLENGIWSLSKERMKGRRPFRIPLPPSAIAVLQKMSEYRDRGEKFVFPGGKIGKPLSNNAMLEVLERMNYGHVTVHGFRSSLRTWAAEQTDFSDTIGRMALSQTVGDKVDAAYQRGDLFDKRKALLEAWDSFSRSGEGSRVLQFPAAR